MLGAHPYSRALADPESHAGLASEPLGSSVAAAHMSVAACRRRMIGRLVASDRATDPLAAYGGGRTEAERTTIGS